MLFKIRVLSVIRFSIDRSVLRNVCLGLHLGYCVFKLKTLEKSNVI